MSYAKSNEPRKSILCPSDNFIAPSLLNSLSCSTGVACGSIACPHSKLPPQFLQSSFFFPFFYFFFFLVHFLPFPCVWLSGKGGVKEEAAGGKLLISCTVPAAMKVGMFTVIYYSYDLVNEFSINAASTCFLSCLVSCHNMPEKEEYHK